MKYIILIIITILFTGCISHDNTDADNVNTKIQDKVKQITDLTTENGKKTVEAITNNGNIAKTGEDIKDKAKSIDTTAKVIANKAPSVKSEADEISKNSNDIIKLTENVKTLTKNNEELLLKIKINNEQIAELTRALSTVSSDLQKIEEQHIADTEKIAQLESDKEKLLFQKLIYIIIFGIITLALSITATINGETKAIGGIVASSVLIITCLAISYFAASLAFIGLIAVLLILVIIGYISYKKYITSKALKEVVQTTETMKTLLPDNVKQEVFKQGNGIATTIQSATTENLIVNERKKLKDKFESVIK